MNDLDPRFCNARKKSGELCKLRAGSGTDHVGWGQCKYHGGSMPNNAKAAARQQTEAEAVKALMKLGLPKDTDPQAELLRQVGISAARVDALHYQFEMSWEELQRAKQDATMTDAVPQLERKTAALMELWDRERVRAAKISKMAVDAGVAKRHVEIAERQGTTIFVVVQNVLMQLGLPQQVQLEARKLLASEFRRVAEGEQEGILA